MAPVHSDLDFRLTLARLAPKVHVATVAGEVDSYREEELRDGLWPLADVDGTIVIVDLCDVPFIDSTGLGVLTGLAQKLRRRAGAIVVVSDDPRMRRLLEVTGLRESLNHESSLARAVENAVGRPGL